MSGLVKDLYQHLVRPLLFCFDAEATHDTVIAALRAVQHSPWLRELLRTPQHIANTLLATSFCGHVLHSPLGVAAGFDKNGEVYNALGALGFGFVEIGTVTLEPQVGNLRPRMFRLGDDHALVNRMGFNNHGARVVSGRLSETPQLEDLVLGVNIGKNKDVPPEGAAENYAACAEWFNGYADYFVINVSSPNTPGLRALQAVEQLYPIVKAVESVIRGQPLLVKIAPDLSDEDVLAVSALVRETGIAGVVATNTTVRRDGLCTPSERVKRCGVGGLSGPPVRTRALEVVRMLREALGPDAAIVGVGGISTSADAWNMLVAGATVVQAYTGFVYGGPTFANDIARGLLTSTFVQGGDDLADAVARHRALYGTGT